VRHVVQLVALGNVIVVPAVQLHGADLCCSGEPGARGRFLLYSTYYTYVYITLSDYCLSFGYVVPISVYTTIYSLLQCNGKNQQK
jgi:hypothetical protein